MKTVTAQELKEKMKEPNWVDSSVLVDIRSKAEVEAQSIPEAIPIPLEEMMNRLSEIPKDKNVYLICASGGRSDFAAMVLEGKGYDNLYSVAGGIMAW